MTQSTSTSRTFAATPDAVFAAFAPTRLARWWGPAGFTNTFETCELRDGGAWRFTMHAPNGVDYPNECTFLEVRPARVVIRHTVPPYFTLSIELAPAPGGTEVRWTQAFDSAETFAQVRAIVEPANEQNLDRLAAEVERGG